MLNIGVLISGGGTNLQAIIDETKSGGINGTVKLVISNKEDAYGLERARLSGIKAIYETDEDKIIGLLKENNIDLIVLAGYLKIITPKFVNGANIALRAPITIETSFLSIFLHSSYFSPLDNPLCKIAISLPNLFLNTFVNKLLFLYQLVQFYLRKDCMDKL